MRWTTTSAVMAMSLVPCLSGCGDTTTKNVTQKMGETWDAMKTWGIEKKDDLVKASSQKLDELKPALAEAKKSASAASADAAQKWDEEWKVVEQKFDAMKSSTGDQWGKARDAFIESYDGFKKKLSNATGK
jgi:hypothetical protein